MSRSGEERVEGEEEEASSTVEAPSSANTASQQLAEQDLCRLLLRQSATWWGSGSTVCLNE